MINKIHLLIAFHIVLMKPIDVKRPHKTDFIVFITNHTKTTIIVMSTINSNSTSAPCAALSGTDARLRHVALSFRSYIIMCISVSLWTNAQQTDSRRPNCLWMKHNTWDGWRKIVTKKFDINVDTQLKRTLWIVKYDIGCGCHGYVCKIQIHLQSMACGMCAVRGILDVIRIMCAFHFFFQITEQKYIFLHPYTSLHAHKLQHCVFCSPLRIKQQQQLCICDIACNGC